MGRGLVPGHNRRGLALGADEGVIDKKIDQDGFTRSGLALC